ncbi:MAG: phosphatase PAP2 family protein [Clostridium sp.]|nr:phosphatase PAP2 family protein [Clostridium sp.]
MKLIENIDYSILEFVRMKLKNPFMDKWMVFITRQGDIAGIWIIIAIVMFTIDGHFKDGASIILTLALCAILGNLILKNIFSRKRPFHTKTEILLLIPKPKDYSFPSGHTMSSIAAATVIFNMNHILGIISWIIAILIAFSRIYLYVHYPSDIAAGAIAGFLTGIFTIYIMNLEFINRIINYIT